jgi:hypothetical protein
MCSENPMLICYEQGSFLEPLKRLGEEERRTDSIRIASLQG